ncbi:PLP-dependent aminotransferase family protein [Acetivibrio ethanolgignens]|nr:PLP-dependent aminotransferase family protein [Acetivibrio ethanolgignens]
MRRFLYNQMKYSIDASSAQSAYMQLYLQLRHDITNSLYKYGDRLPSKRFLAAETMTSVVTVEHAYNILCDEGYIEARERSGYYVTYKKRDFFPVLEAEEKEVQITPSHYNRDESFPFSVFARTMRNVLSKYGEQILIKPPNLGSHELQRAISDYLARSKGIKVMPHQIVIGSGAEYLYSLLVQLLGRDRIYALENPSYDKIYSVYTANGIECDMLKMGKDGILTAELNKTRASVLHVTPFKSFPSGVTASASKRNEYIEWAAKRDGIIIEDDFGSEFTVSTKHEDTVFSLEPLHSVIYINTFSKTIAPSMRIGYMVLPSELVEVFLSKIGFYSCTVPAFEQYVLAEFINNGDFERHINRVRRRRRQEEINKGKQEVKL